MRARVRARAAEPLLRRAEHRFTLRAEITGAAPGFRTLIERLEKSGPLRVDAVKTSIHLVSRHHFGGSIGFLAPRAIESERIARIEVLGPRRVAHHVVVRRAADIDKELLSWLKIARDMQS